MNALYYECQHMPGRTALVLALLLLLL